MEKSGFFNSSGGDRLYDAADFAGYFSKLVTSGIFYTAASNLQVTPGSGMFASARGGQRLARLCKKTQRAARNLSTADGGSRA